MEKRLLIVAVLSAVFVTLVGCGHRAAPVVDDSQSTVLDLATVAFSVLYLEVYNDQNELVGTASGFLIDDAETLVTNYHVIEDAYSITAWTEDGTSSVQVNTVLAYDEVADLAVLRCEESLGVLPLEIADSGTAKQGDAIFAIGYPLGVANTLSDGIISSIYTDDNGIEIIQITAAISSGSSGGALIDASSHVVGIICSSYIDGQNMNIAIASNMLTELLEKDTNEISLAEMYNSKSRPKGLTCILENREKLDGERVQVEAYISSEVVFEEMDGNQWVNYILVGNRDDVLGYIGYGYSESFFNDEDYQKFFVGYEYERAEEYLAISIELNDPECIYQPGEIIIVEGTVDNVVYVDERYDINWHHVLLRNPQIVS